MNELIVKVFIDGEFHYKPTYKRAKLVDKAIKRIGGNTESEPLDRFVAILNSLIKGEYISDAKRDIREGLE